MEGIRLITFCVGDQNLAIPIDQVREVIRYVPVEGVSKWTGLLHGIINLRGVVIPILDLRRLLGASGEVENTRKTRIIIVDILERTTGIIVDQVDDIAPLTSGDLVPLSSIAMERTSSVLVGVAKLDSKLHLVLDVKKLIHEEDRSLFQDICLRISRQQDLVGGASSV